MKKIIGLSLILTSFLISAINKNENKIIYLTFDDGPFKSTKNILSAINDENVCATMFFVGSQAKKNKKRLNFYKSQENILIANHTYSHANGKYKQFYKNPNYVLKDINKAEKILCCKKNNRLAGRNVWRLPDLIKNDAAIKRKSEIISYDKVASEGYNIYGWDIEWKFNPKTSEPLWDGFTMANKINNFYKYRKPTKKNKIVLLAHDFMFKDKYNGKLKLKNLIKELKNTGWKFETVDMYSEPCLINPIKIKENNIEKNILEIDKEIKLAKEKKENLLKKKKEFTENFIKIREEEEKRLEEIEYARLAEIKIDSLENIELSQLKDYEEKKLIEKKLELKLEEERIAKLEKERLAKLEKERLAKLEEERIAKLERERIAKLERERIAKLERERLSKLEEEKIAKLKRERLAKLERERLAKLERERIAKLEKERLAKLERERIENLNKLKEKLKIAKRKREESQKKLKMIQIKVKEVNKKRLEEIKKIERKEELESEKYIDEEYGIIDATYGAEGKIYDDYEEY